MKKIVSICLVLCIIFSLNVYGANIVYVNPEGENVTLKDFLDTQGHWAHDTILKVADYELVVGDNGNFMPDQPIRRGDLAIIMDRMLGLKATTYNMFNDLPNDAYYREALLRCVAAGYITGVSNNEVDPNGYATREQVASIIARIFNLDTSYGGSTNFKDDANISGWARPSVSVMAQLGYLNGSEGYVNPQSNITRAEFVTLLNNIANVYIPRQDTTHQGYEFTGEYPSNIVTSRNIYLSNAEVGRDLVLTQDSSSLSLTNTKVYGCILVLSKANIDMSNSDVQRIVIVDGKASITGAEDVKEVYVCKYGSETTLDKIPTKVVLEAGVRVNINGTMYENDTTRTKTYYASDLQADIAAEQGYIVGGPKVTGAKFEQDMDNTIKVSDVRISAGTSDVKEIGVVWIGQNEKQDAINPTYQKNDGKKVYRSAKIDEAISFEVGEVRGTAGYRVYVRDKEGLYAYSDTYIFTEYEFTTTMRVYDNEYPKTVDVEIVFKGDKVPDLSSVRVVYDTDDTYKESRAEISLHLYSDPDAEVQPDESKYKRYVGTITSPYTRQGNEDVYTPPTDFGYIINFRNGTIVNRFPVLTNVVPDGVSPMARLQTGVAEIVNNSLLIRDNEISTNYTIPQEVGVVYKTTDATSVGKPAVSSNGWTKKEISSSIETNDTATYNVTIPLSSNYEYTYYAAYVKTSNGYWYGDVRKFNNDVQGDEGGPIINSTPEIVVLNDTTVAIGLTISNIGDGLDYSKPFVLSDEVGNLEGKRLTDFWYVEDNGSIENSKCVYFVVTSLQSNTVYNLGLRVVNMNNLKSNMVSVTFNTKDKVEVSIGEGILNAYNWYTYTTTFSKPYIYLGSGHTITQGRINSNSTSSFDIIEVPKDSEVRIALHCEFKPIGTQNGFTFEREISLLFDKE